MPLRSLFSRTWPSRPLLCALALALAACPADDTGTDSGADSGASTTASSTTEPGMTSTTEPGMTSTTEPGTTAGDATTEPTATDTTADSGETGPGGIACGELTCSESGEWCDWSDEVCGEGSGSSTCEALPKGCPANEEPVCGCDGQVHSNTCVAHMNGVDLDAEGECPTPDGYFRCGYRFCNLAFEYCRVQISDIGGEGDSYTCEQPGCPGDITCDCLGDEVCFMDGCEPTPDGGVQIVCPGG